MKIITVPHPSLKKVSVAIEQPDQKLVKFIGDMEKTLKYKKNPEGVGLSAPQVDNNIRAFSTYLEVGNTPRKIRTYINPAITKASEQMTLGPDPKKPFLEGCLSIPDIYGAVPRHQWVKLSWQEITQEESGELVFTEQSKRFESFPARVIQHELDHLDGILFTERTLMAGLPLYQDNGSELIELDTL